MSDTTKLGDSRSGLASLVRPHFTAGLLLQDDDLTAGVTYTRALSRLMFRTLFGCGVMCGLKVKEPELNKCGDLTLLVEKGLALDCIGDPVEVPNDQSVTLTCATDIGTELWVALRRYEKCCAPRTAVCSEDAEPPSACTRERDGFEIQVFGERPCSCGCSRLEEPDTTPTPTPAPAPAAAPAAATAPKKTAAKKKAAAKTAYVAGQAAETDEPLPDEGTDCKCNHRHGNGACYHDFYEGKCPCECCDCEWILLAVAERPNTNTDVWTVDHSVRRFIRPVLMRDPLAPV